MKQSDGMTVIVKTITRMSVWLIILYGIYIILHGHLTPGGGFAGGVIIALAFLNVMLAYGRKYTEQWLNVRIMYDLVSTGAILFLIIGIFGIALKGSFLANILDLGELFKLESAGVIPIIDIFIGVIVSMGLFVMVWTLAVFHLEDGGEE